MKVDFTVDGGPPDWAALADPEVLAARLPACRAARPVDGGLLVTVDVAVAGATGALTATVTPVPGGGVRIAGSGEPGTVDVVARLDGDGVVTVTGEVTGTLAGIGAGVLVAGARRLAATLVHPDAPPVALPTTGAPDAEPSPEDADTRPTALVTVTDHRAGRAGKLAAGAAAGAAVAAVARSLLRRKVRR